MMLVGHRGGRGGAVALVFVYIEPLTMDAYAVSVTSLVHLIGLLG